MGKLLSWLGFRDPSAYAVQNVTAGSGIAGIASPWSGPSHLASVIVDDIFGIKTTALTRREAMQIPAVKKARDLICLTLARYPLVAYKDGVKLEEQPTWLARTDTGVSPRMRTVWVIDDLFFYGWSLLAVDRGAKSADQARGPILDAARVPWERWRFNDAMQVEVLDSDGKTWRGATQDEVILIPGPSEGLLELAGRTIRGARNLEDRWTARVNNPTPNVEIRYTGDEDLEPEEQKDIRDKYIEARNDPSGIVSVMPKGFEVHVHTGENLDLFVEGRNAVSLDVARFANMPAGLLDASNINATSVNYSNTSVKRNEFYDLTLRGWALPYEDRLSMDDCVPRGTYVQFDLTDLVEAPDPGTGPKLED